MPINSFIYPAPSTPPAYSVANSCRSNAGDSAYLHKSQGSGNRRTFTISFWVKRSRLNDRQAIFSATVDGSNECFIWFDTDDELFVKENTSNSTNFELRTNRVFRDPSAWYHICVAYDTTDGTAGDRVRIYVNGTEETSFANETQPDQDFQTKFNDGSSTLNIGRMNYDSEYFGGYLAEVCLIDGSALTPTSFGEFDEDSPTIWKPIDVSGLTFGTNGFYLDFEASDNLGNDANGGTDLTEVNLAATDQATDTPTNNFCTMNPLDNFYAGATFSEGNLKIVTASSTRTWVRSTFGVNTGKWYWEQRLTVASTDSAEDDVVGIVDRATTTALLSLDSSSSCPGLVLRENGRIFTYLSGSSGETTGWNTFGDDDIVMVALDLDNNKIYFGTNGTWGNSSDPAGDSNGFAITHASSGGHDDFWYCAVSILNNNSSNTWEVNFGCPTFTISSSNADDDGYGNFEYAVPSGFYALCSKNLAEYG